MRSLPERKKLESLLHKIVLAEQGIMGNCWGYGEGGELLPAWVREKKEIATKLNENIGGWKGHRRSILEREFAKN